MSFYRALVYGGNSLQPFFLLAIRLFWGYQFFQSGLGKLLHLENTAQYFASLHIPLPLLNAYLVGSIECFGGICLFFGLASRLVAIPLIINMLVAYLTTEQEAIQSIYQNPLEITTKTPYTFLMAALIIFIFGPGKFSIDALLEKFFGKK